MKSPLCHYLHWAFLLSRLHDMKRIVWRGANDFFRAEIGHIFPDSFPSLVSAGTICPRFFFTLSPWPFISRSNFRTTRFPVDTLVPALPSHRIYQSNTCFPYIITCLGASFSPSSSDTLDNPSSRKCSVNHISTTRYIIILKIWHLESNLLFIIVSYATQEHVRLPCFWKTPTWIYTEKAIRIVVGMERRLVEHKHIYRNMEWITHS